MQKEKYGGTGYNGNGQLGIGKHNITNIATTNDINKWNKKKYQLKVIIHIC